jgi:hypothetical protein
MNITNFLAIGISVSRCRYNRHFCNFFCWFASFSAKWYCKWIRLILYVQGHGDSLRWPRDTLYPLKLALTSPTSDGRSVGIVRWRTKASKFVFFLVFIRSITVRWLSIKLIKFWRRWFVFISRPDHLLLRQLQRLTDAEWRIRIKCVTVTSGKACSTNWGEEECI